MTTKSKVILFGVVLITMACSLGLPTPTAQPQTDRVGTLVAATMQALSAEAPTQAAPTEYVPTQVVGTPITFNNVSFIIPTGLASGASVESVPVIGENDGAPWEVAPAHIVFTLNGYLLQGKFHEPRIYIFPADEFANTNEGAAKNIQALKNPPQWSLGVLPHIPFFNAAQVFAAQILPIQSNSSSGIRFLTEYAQYFASINNQDLFYHFQGLTSDGTFYVIAILPITSPLLAPEENPDSPVPADGVPVPMFDDPNADFQSYYNAVTDKLNSADANSFTPTLSQLDALIQSIIVVP